MAKYDRRWKSPEYTTKPHGKALNTHTHTHTHIHTHTHTHTHTHSEEKNILRNSTS